MFNTIFMTEDYWRSSQFSVAAHYGGLQINQHHYVLCNKFGVTVFELSDPGSPSFVGYEEKKAIQPGEPVDLVRLDWVPIYRIVGRNKLFDMLKDKVSFDKAVELVTKKKYDGLKKLLRKSLPSCYL